MVIGGQTGVGGKRQEASKVKRSKRMKKPLRLMDL